MIKIASPYKQFASFDGLQGAADAAGMAFVGPAEDDAPEPRGWDFSGLASFGSLTIGVSFTAMAVIWWAV